MAALLLFAGCEAKTTKPTATAGSSTAAPAPVTPSAAAPPVDAAAPVAVAPAANPDDSFRAAVQKYATRTSRYVAGWGTVRADGTSPTRFATLLPNEANNARGAYLFELGDKRAAVVSYDYDGRTQPFHGGDGVQQKAADVAWEVSPDTVVRHAAGHHHGGETIGFGLRDGQLVVMSYSYTDDASDPASKPIEETFVAKPGQACSPKCPLLASHKYQDSGLAVSEGASLDAITEVAPKP